jgi:hypothetical protein
VAQTTTERLRPLSQFVFQEGADFAVALADHGDHRDVGRIVAGHGAEQGAFADAAAAEDADALAFAAGQQASMARMPVTSGSGVMCSR